MVISGGMEANLFTQICLILDVKFGRSLILLLWPLKPEGVSKSMEFIKQTGKLTINAGKLRRRGAKDLPTKKLYRN